MRHANALIILSMVLLTVSVLSAKEVMPDVMGIINTTDDSYEAPAVQPVGIDNFTVLPNWPVHLNGYSHEGGVCTNMDADPELEIIYYLAQTIYALNIDGTNVPGWPVNTLYYSTGGPAVGDIDGDGDDEIVVGSYYGSTAGQICAYEMDGTPVSGFPINHGYSSRSPVLYDLDDDGAMEILTNKRMYPVGEWWVYRGDGTVFPGWPQPIGHVPSSSSGVGDVDGDGLPEVIGESYDALYVWDAGGNLLPGFPYYMPNGATNSYSSPVVADLDQDGLNEIVFGTHTLSGDGYVFVLNGDGTAVPGWPQHSLFWIYGPPAVGYIDNDNELDIAVGDQVLSGTPVDRLYAWNANGIPLPGFPITNLPAINNQVALADLDGDGMTELLVDDNITYEGNIGKYHAYNHDGSLVAGFPLETIGTSFFNMVSLTDCNNDGFLDLVGAGKSAIESWMEIYVWGSDVAYDPASVQIPSFQYDIQNTGIYPGGEITPPDLSVTLTPTNPPIIIPANGGTFDFNLYIENIGTSTANFDAWLEADLPAGGTFSPVLLREDLSLPVGGFLDRNMMQTVPGNAPAGQYTYRLNVGSYPGTVYASDEFNFSKDSVLVVGSGGDDWQAFGWEENELVNESPIPEKFALLQNYPNPFNPITMISFQLPEATNVSLTVYSVTGEKVASLVDGYRNAGHHQVTFNASALASGVYLYRMETSQFTAAGKMVLMK